MPPRLPPTYWDYLKLDRLLVLQGGIDGDEGRLQPDELHFIVVHQVYELWFKLVLRELRLAREHLAAKRVPEERIPYVVHHLRRVGEILKLAIEQFRLMETLTPQDFLDFREKLSPASGLQSFQMYEIEVLLGLDEGDRAAWGAGASLATIRELAKGSPAGEYAWLRLEETRRLPSLREVLLGWLHRTPIQGSSPGAPGDAETVAAFVEAYLAASDASARRMAETVARAGGADPEKVRARFDSVQAAHRAYLEAEDVPETERARTKRIRAAILFIESYRELPLLVWPRNLVDAVVEVEEQLLLWRNRHARMVERTIGRRVGTGGTAGVDYLEETSRHRIFKELWAVRSMLLPRAALPPLLNREFYGFAR